MPVVAFYATAATLEEADLLLDTHINILPSSPDIIRLQCALREPFSEMSVPAYGPIVTCGSAARAVVDGRAHFQARAVDAQKYAAAGKLVLLKNGSRSWRAEESEDAHILLKASRHNLAHSTGTHFLAIDDATAETWDPAYVIETTGRSMLEVQNDVRRILVRYCPPKLLGLSADMMMQPVVHRNKLRAVIALGGLSECGKSMLGREVDTVLGERGRREKLGYFFMNATKELGLNANALPEPIQGHLLVQQIEEYAKAHYWVSVLSLESIHQYESIAEAKRVLGPLLHIIYVDASEDVRIQREVSRVGSKRMAEMVEEEVRRKDEIKRARGAHRVLEIADTVLDNHGSVESTCRVLYALLDHLTR